MTMLDIGGLGTDMSERRTEERRDNRGDVYQPDFRRVEVPDVLQVQRECWLLTRDDPSVQ